MVSQPKILLVDDEQAITSNLAPFLERSGFTIEVAGDGEEALYVWDEAIGRGRQVLELPDRAGHLALSPLGYLAYTLDDTLYLADPSAGTTREVYSAMGRTAPDWDLRWSADGRVLALCPGLYHRHLAAHSVRDPEPFSPDVRPDGDKETGWL